MTGQTVMVRNHDIIPVSGIPSYFIPDTEFFRIIKDKEYRAEVLAKLGVANLLIARAGLEDEEHSGSLRCNFDEEIIHDLSLEDK